MPLPIIVPETIEVACQTLSPRSSSGRCSPEVEVAFRSVLTFPMTSLFLKLAPVKHSDAHAPALYSPRWSEMLR